MKITDKSKQNPKPHTSQFVLINVNGLNSAQKRGRIFEQLKKLNADVLCLQETHIKEKDVYLLINKKYVNVYMWLTKKKKREGW